jgi:hypothetical protein
MSNGFLDTTPGARHGNSALDHPANAAIAQHFIAPGSEILEIVEVGIWCSVDSGHTGYFHLGIFSDDTVNGCPEALISNSDSGELSQTNTSIAKKLFTYSTKPQVMGGTHYWLAGIIQNAYLNTDYFTSGGNTLSKPGLTYPTWPTGKQWETHTDRTWDLGIYVVYQSLTTGPKIVQWIMDY